MASSTGRLQADPLFQGLSRPPMIMGVSYLYFVFNAVFCLLFFIHTSNFVALLFMGPVIHCIGYLLCLKEPRAVELLLLRARKGYKCINKPFHGFTNSYDIF
jgi:type IV secretion system protein VirB3